MLSHANAGLSTPCPATAVYQFRYEEIDLKTYPFSEPVPVGIFEGLVITISDLTA